MAEASPVVVQKFGGTSVADPAGRRALAARVSEALSDGKSVVVVVSAMGRSGSPYATDTLLSLVDGLPPDGRELDMLAACGELISAVVVAHELRSRGIEAAAFSGGQAGIVTDAAHGGARIASVDAAPLARAISAGTVPVVAGFQGCTPEGMTTTLGRGGSDTTACALGVALSAEAVEIYTDVEGVMTADPRVCPDATVLHAVEYEELFQMAHHGAKVMHAPAAEVAMLAGVPLRVLSPSSEGEGTLVADSQAVATMREERVVTAVSHLDTIARASVVLPADVNDPEHMVSQARVYRVLADAGVSLDMFTPCGDQLVFTMSEAAVADAVRALDTLETTFSVETGLAKVTLVGSGMRGVPGVMARIAEALRDAHAPVLQTADSYTTISVLVPQSARSAAVQALHSAFGLSE